jgi:HEPN domain-containing protein
MRNEERGKRDGTQKNEESPSLLHLSSFLFYLLPMQPGSDKLLAKAERAASAAEAALEQGAVDIAAGRAFAALLNAAKALLNERGLRLRTHARIAAALAAQPPLDGGPAEWLADALVARRRLAVEGEPDYRDVERLVERARRFVEAAARSLR